MSVGVSMGLLNVLFSLFLNLGWFNGMGVSLGVVRVVIRGVVLLKKVVCRKVIIMFLENCCMGLWVGLFLYK